MARIRSLKPDVWEDEALGYQPVAARILFLGLITQADDYGRLRGAPDLLRSKVFPYDPDDVTTEDVDGWLQGLATAGLIVRYRVNRQRYIAIKGWFDHQRVDKPTPSKLPPPEADEGPETPVPTGYSRTLANVRELSAKPRESSCLEGKGRDKEVTVSGSTPVVGARDVEPLEGSGVFR